MKKLLLLLFTIALNYCSFAQPYEKMLGNTRTSWFTTNCYQGNCLNDYYIAYGDTFLNNNTYRFLDYYHYNKNFLIREDTVTRKIYMKVWNSVEFSKDYLLYDFALNIGDSMELFNPVSPLPTSAGYFVLDSITVFNGFTGPRRKFHLSKHDNSDQTLWVEGLGSLALINTSSSMPDLNGIGELICAYKDGAQQYLADTLPLGSCNYSDLPPLSTNELLNKNEINIYPNPAKSFINISNNTKIASLSIYNIAGKVVYKQTVNQHSTFIDLNNLLPSLYLVKIVDRQKAITFKKLVVQ